MVGPDHLYQLAQNASVTDWCKVFYFQVGITFLYIHFSCVTFQVPTAILLPLATNFRWFAVRFPVLRIWVHHQRPYGRFQTTLLVDLLCSGWPWQPGILHSFTSTAPQWAFRVHLSVLFLPSSFETLHQLVFILALPILYQLHYIVSRRYMVHPTSLVSSAIVDSAALMRHLMALTMAGFYQDASYITKVQIYFGTSTGLPQLFTTAPLSQFQLPGSSLNPSPCRWA